MSTFGFAGKSKRSFSGGAELNLTPMIDMFVILIVFLIKSYSTSPTYLTPTQDIELSQTESEEGAPDKPALIVGRDGLILNGSTIVSFQDGKPSSQYLRTSVIPELRTVLLKLKEVEAEFTGTLILQADKGVEFNVLKPILKTAGAIGYNDIKFAGVYKE